MKRHTSRGWSSAFHRRSVPRERSRDTRSRPPPSVVPGGCLRPAMSRAWASAHFQTTLFLSAIPKRQVPSKGGKGTGHGREAPEDRADSQHGTYHVGQVHAHGHVAVAAVVLEPVVAQQQRDERDVRAVHRLQREPVAGAVEVGVGDEVLDGLEHLLQEASLDETGLKHVSCVGA